MFRPSAEEFTEVVAYIRRISATGAAAGMARIIPPAGKSLTTVAG